MQMCILYTVVFAQWQRKKGLNISIHYAFKYYKNNNENNNNDDI